MADAAINSSIAMISFLILFSSSYIVDSQNSSAVAMQWIANISSPMTSAVIVSPSFYCMDRMLFKYNR